MTGESEGVDVLTKPIWELRDAASGPTPPACPQQQETFVPRRNLLQEPPGTGPRLDDRGPLAHLHGLSLPRCDFLWHRPVREKLLDLGQGESTRGTDSQVQLVSASGARGTAR